MKKITSLVLGAAMLLMSSFSAMAQNATNGQSVMVKVIAPTSINVVENRAFAYNTTTASSFFVNQATGTVTATCVGEGSAINNTYPQGGPCNPINRPAVSAQPAPPAPNAAKLAEVVESSKCTFWSGGDLNATSTYSQTSPTTISVSKPKKAGNSTTPAVGMWSYSYDYEVKANPLGVSSVGERTAWDEIPSNASAGSVDVELSGIIAAQDTLAKAKAPLGHWLFKTSHRLVSGFDEFGLPVAQVSDLQATLIGPDGNAVGDPTPLTYTLHQNEDFTFSNVVASTNLPNAVLGKVSDIHNGVAKTTSGKGDDFAGNNADLGDFVELTPFTYTLSQSGNYSVQITGTVKSITLAGATVSTPFSVSLSINYSTADGSCSMQ
jgi:hypothetical protein